VISAPTTTATKLRLSETSLRISTPSCQRSN
jgi:hypothetical protein